VRIQVALEQFEDPAVFVRPRRWLDEPVVFHRIHRHLPVAFAEFDQALREPDDVGEMHVSVHHTVGDQQRVLQAFREVDR
jgi:hypothetical protein